MVQQQTITHWIGILGNLLPWTVALVLLSCIVGIAILASLDVLDYRRLIGRRKVFLELTPPAGSDKTPAATLQMFSVLHGLNASRSWIDKVLRHKVVFAPEVPSTREAGIRLVMCVDSDDVSTFEQTVISYMPDMKVRRIDDYLAPLPQGKRIRVLEFKQMGAFGYPLRSQMMLNQHDPMAYLTGVMTQLPPGDLMSFQVVVSPAVVREAGVIVARMMHNDELVFQLGQSRKLNMTRVFTVLNKVLFGILDLVGEGFHGGSSSYKPQQALSSHQQLAAMQIKPARTLSPLEQELADSVHQKLSQPLFRVSIRVLVAVDDKENEKQRLKGIRNWMSSLGNPQYQSLRPRWGFPERIMGRYRIFAFWHRLPAFLPRHGGLFSAQEIADFIHFPHSVAARTENVIKSLSKILPAPVSLKGSAKLDVILGRNYYHDASTDIGLTAEERERHVFVVGGTGTGKTTLLKYAIVQDIRDGKGVAVVDPHGDLAQELLAYIPEERIKDVIYFNPSDTGYPIGFNLLEIPPGLAGDELLLAKDFIAESVVSIMRKTFSTDGTGGHRIEYILRNAIHTALTVKDATLFTVYDLLIDAKYRKRIVSTLQVEWLKSFWENEFGKAGDYQQVSMMKGVTAKIGRFHASVSAERILSQPKSTINFDEILDGKILICNLAKGLVGEDTSEVLGISILAKLQLAAYGRIKHKRVDRRPFYAYVDEFQNFATVSFVEMLSESRKYKLFLTMAEQTLSQQNDQNMSDIILTNVGSLICFRTSSPADEAQLLPLFSPNVQQGDIANLPAYNFYAKLSGGLVPQEPMSGRTIVLEDTGSQEITDKVQLASRSNYAIVHSETAAAVPVSTSVEKSAVHQIPKEKPRIASRRKKAPVSKK